jgi:dTDP-4-amino-4,6-dideoxygalactose transaminase
MDSVGLDDVLDAHRVACVIATHLYGRMCDAAAIVAVCDRHGIPLIEDCAQAHGARRGGRMAGSYGRAGCYSFYPTKNLGALGDAGAIVTNDDDVATGIRALRQYGWGTKYTVVRPGGRNSRLDEMQAAVLRVKLPHLDAWNARRRAIAARYSDEIAHAAVTCPPTGGEDYVAHLYVVAADDRDGLRTHLLASGIATDIHYPVPDHHQPAFITHAHLPSTESAAGRILTLPCFPEMTENEVSRVVTAVNGW